MEPETFAYRCNRVGNRIVNGGKITKTDLLKIYKNFDVKSISPLLLPDNGTTSGPLKQRRERIFFLVEKIWGKPKDYWLELENTWISVANSYPNVPMAEPKESVDLVVPKLLYRILSVAKCIADNRNNRVKVNGALNALNSYLFELCSKGNIMMKWGDTRPIFEELIDAGVILDGDKYLPNPYSNLPVVLQMFSKEKSSSEAK